MHVHQLSRCDNKPITTQFRCLSFNVPLAFIMTFEVNFYQFMDFQNCQTMQFIIIWTTATLWIDQNKSRYHVFVYRGKNRAILRRYKLILHWKKKKKTKGKITSYNVFVHFRFGVNTFCKEKRSSTPIYILNIVIDFHLFRLINIVDV